MRDLFLTLFIFGMLPNAFLQPQVGLYLWTWISYMNPHRLTWSYAYSFRFNLFVALVTILGIIYSWGKTSKIPRFFPVYLMGLFFVWTTITSFYAFSPGNAWKEWEQFLKIYLMIIATFLLVDSRKSLSILMVIITFSIGFFGVKGGIFTITTGGRFHIVGPSESFFSDNNTFALAEIMVFPLFLFLRSQAKHWLLRFSFLVMTFLAVLSVVGSYSRGGLVGLAVVIIYFWLRTPGKIKITVILALVLPVIATSMPEKWQNRMYVLAEEIEIPVQIKELLEVRSVFDQRNDPFPLDAKKEEVPEGETSELMEDLSVQGRFEAWTFAWNLVQDRPIVGGGFRMFRQDAFDIYHPGVRRRDAHSIYFEVMGEQGFVGLVLWLMLHISAFRVRGRIMKLTKNLPELNWAYELARYIGIGMMGYYAAGAFLGLAYFDLPFHYISILVILQVLVEKELSKNEPPKKRGRFPHIPKKIREAIPAEPSAPVAPPG
ncbi:MAG: putative O-glycosylation ligase, exosortase A system-associated [Magnetococcales bacterium]|nr:putative O-glycosylation ligase, exosortase A system-associated [Magnetococcales bacterium]